MSFRKRMMSAALAVLMTCSICVTLVLAEDSKKKEEEVVTILFTHDIHSRLDEYKSGSSVIGGVGRLKTEVNKKKEENPATFLFDGGDFSMGTLYQTIYETDAAELTMLGRMGYDATTFGNHEFDYRSQGVANMFHSALENAAEDDTLTLPQFVIANIDWETNDDDDDKLIRDALEDYGSTPYTIIERSGVRVGVYGVVGEDAQACAPESGLVFEDIVETSKEVVKELEKEDVDMIVCLSHSGTAEDEDKSEDEILAKEVPEIDVIISGHTHSTLSEPIVHGDTTIVSAGCYGQNLGELNLVATEDGRWKVEDYQLAEMKENVAVDEEITAYLKDYKKVIDDTYLSRFGYTADQVLAENDITFSEVDDLYARLEESNLGNLISDSYVYAVKQAEGDSYEPIDLAVVASGVIRDTFPKGEITVSDAFNVSALGIGADRITGYPLVSVYLTGAELKTVAEIDVSVSQLMAAAQLYPSGMKWIYNPNRLILNRITSVGLTSDCVGQEDKVYFDQMEKLEDDKLYRVVSGLYSAQMLGAVEDTSKGILKITPKNKDGEKITDFEEYIIHDQKGNEVKEWYALASYLESFEENEDGISVIPERYEGPEGRKEMQDTKNIIELLKNPNKIALVVYGVIVFILLLVVLLIRLWYTKIYAKKKAKEKVKND